MLNGNALAAAGPGAQTADAARRLQAEGHRAIQLAYPAMGTTGAFRGLAARIQRLSRGQPIGLVGFSAGGALALRLATVPGLNVKAVLNFYGPPDLQDWLDYHRGDENYRHVVSHVRLTPGLIDELSGPARTSAAIINAFGLRDTNIVAGRSAASFQRDFASGAIYTYPGPHGVGVGASPAAFDAFLAQLDPNDPLPTRRGARAGRLV